MDLIPEGLVEPEKSPKRISIICWPYISAPKNVAIPIIKQEALTTEISLKTQRKLLQAAHSRKDRRMLEEHWRLLKKERKKRSELAQKEQQKLVEKAYAEELKLFSTFSRLLGSPVLLPIIVSIVVLVISYQTLFPTHSEFLAIIIFFCYFILAISVSLWPAFTTFILPSSLSRVEFTSDEIEFRRLLWGTKIARASIVRWRDVTDVYVRKSDGLSQPDCEVCFKEGPGKVWSLKFQQIATKEQWAKVLEALDKWCPVTPRNLDRDAFNRISPSELTFTTLWLDSLSEPPHRHRLGPIPSGAILQKGHYLVQRQIGLGGQGRAYLAKDNTNSSVVIKEYILPINVDIKARRQALESFQREASMLASLNHPNIVKLIEFFSEDHSAYLVMEYVDGASLKSLVQEKGVPAIETAVGYGAKICDILNYLHNRTPPIVHGDLTPENLIVDSSGSLKLIDFTIAQQSESTVTSIIAGKSAYMPPEQFQGLLTTQSDIYALGATLYYLLTGEDPEPISCLHPILIRSDVSSVLDAVVSKCTALDAAQRYPSATAVRKALNELTNDEAT